MPDRILGGPGSTLGLLDVVAGDIDGDGASDLVTANATGSSLSVFLQGASGFSSMPDRVLAHATASGPATVALADIDMDGDLDVVSGNGGGNVTIFLQILPGRFRSAPEAFGDPGATDTPRSLRVVDIDHDGDPDIALCNQTGDRVAVYFGNH